MYSLLLDFFENFRHNLFKPLLLFFYMGFLVPILGVKLEFPHQIYQGLTIFLLVAIGWKGGEELSLLGGRELSHAGGLMVLGVITNFVIGITAYLFLRTFTKLRNVDAATVAGYYGSDSAGTYATAVGVLSAANIVFAPYMPVMLAVMEIPGCLVALVLVAMLRRRGMDPAGNMPNELGYDPGAQASLPAEDAHNDSGGGHSTHPTADGHGGAAGHSPRKASLLSPALLHEVFLNPGIYLLLFGILIGFVSGLQGAKVTKDDDLLFVNLFQGMLCLFLLEMGMTASGKLRDLKSAGLPFILHGVIAPNIYATMGIVTAHLYSRATGVPLDQGTYVLFAVLCGAASYIAVPAVQRLAIPEASPTLPLAASLGLTFSYNVTIGIPLYILISKVVQKYL